MIRTYLPLVALAASACSSKRAAPADTAPVSHTSPTVDAATAAARPPNPDRPCPEPHVVPAGAALVLDVVQPDKTSAVIDVGLRNTGTDAVCVYSHIATHEWQSDWLSVSYSDGEKYHHFERPIRLNDSRDKSAAVRVLLEPGEVIWHTVDVGAWALRPANGAEALSSGSLYAHAIYDTSGERDVWAGRLMTQFELIAP